MKSLEICSPQNIAIIHEDNKGSLWKRQNMHATFQWEVSRGDDHS